MQADAATVSMRVSKRTLQWTKRVQGYLKYIGRDYTLDQTLQIAIAHYDYTLAKASHLITCSFDDYIKRTVLNLDKDVTEDEIGGFSIIGSRE